MRCTFFCFEIKPTLIQLIEALHAVEDETQKDEGVVAVVNLHILHHPLAELSEVSRFRELPLVNKTGPRSNGHPAAVKPFFSHADWEAFGKPQPGK